MTEAEILKKVVDLTIGRKIGDVVIPIRKVSFKYRFLELLRGNFKPIPYKVFELFESVSGNTFRIAAAAAQLPNEILGNSVAEAALPLIEKHHSTIVYIVAAGITNTKAEPSNELIDMITWNLSYKDLHEALHTILGGAGMEAFINSTILTKGTDKILKPKIDPMDAEEPIASHNE